MTPLLFEAGSGILEPRHAVNPLRPLLNRVRFIEAEIQSIDLAARRLHTQLAHCQPLDIPFDHLVLSLGGITNTTILPGADEHAMTFKTLADAIALRNHVIRLFEQADVEHDPQHRGALLTFVVIGAGFVGVELMGELTIFVRNLARSYPRVDATLLRFELIEALARVAPEFDEDLADYAANVLRGRGVNVRVKTPVERIDAGVVRLKNGSTIDTRCVVVATGVTNNPLAASLDLEKGKAKRIKVEATMRVPGRENIWAIGDCAEIPDPHGHPYPPLAQHALREARVLGDNLLAAIDGRPLKPFVYRTKGSLAALGHFKGIGKIGPIRIRGFLAWWVWRTYYLMQMPQWSRRLRIVIDWTVGLFFRNDIVQLDLSARKNDP